MEAEVQRLYKVIISATILIYGTEYCNQFFAFRISDCTESDNRYIVFLKNRIVYMITLALLFRFVICKTINFHNHDRLMCQF